MLQDKSKDKAETWDFLNRRIEDGVHVQEVLSTSEGTARNAAHAVGSAFITVSSISYTHHVQILFESVSMSSLSNTRLQKQIAHDG